MRPIILIASCVPYALGKEQKVARELWLHGIPYKFVLGDGTPTIVDESILDKSWNNRHYRYQNNTEQSLLWNYKPKEDELLFKMPDDYKHCTFKVQESYKWALENNYTHAFICCVDTYIQVDRIINSGYEKHDYTGFNHGIAACGGKGYWLSEKSLEICTKITVTTWAWDSWTGEALGLRGVVLNHDIRYNAYPIFPRINNEIITSHLNISPDVYDVKRAIEVHNIYQGEVKC